MINKAQLKLIHTLFSGYAKFRGFPIEREEKQQFVQECSGGRCTSTTQLTTQEARVLIDSLNGLISNTSDYQKADRERKLIIHYAWQMAWTKNGKADIARINAWCEKSGYLHKPLMSHTLQELPRLVQQFERMYKAFLKSI